MADTTNTTPMKLVDVPQVDEVQSDLNLIGEQGREWKKINAKEELLPRAELGAAHGVAQLDSEGRIPASQLPSYVDDVIEGYLNAGVFYEDAEYTTQITAEGSKVYVDLNTNLTYRWSGNSYVKIASDLALGETSSTAYRGDRGKIAYDHSQLKGNAFASNLYKFATNEAGHVTSATLVKGADIVSLIGNPDWEQETTSATDYIKNKPPIKNGNGEKSVVIGYGDAIGDYSIAKGYDTIAGGMCFIVTDRNGEIGGVGTYTLDSVEGLEIDDEYSIRLTSNFDYRGTITSVDNETNTITVSNYIDEDNVTNTITLWIPSKPLIGTTQLGGGAYAEGYGTRALCYGSHSEGYNTEAGGRYSHAEGNGTKAGYSAHAEGNGTKAFGTNSHAEGNSTTSLGNNSHSEGAGGIAKGINSHAEGYNTQAIGSESHAEGKETIAEGAHSHSEGYKTHALKTYSHAEGCETHADGIASHSEGKSTYATGDYSHSEGASTKAGGTASHAEGYNTKALGNESHTEGYETSCSAKARYSHAEGYQVQVTGEISHGEGCATYVEGNYSHAEGNRTKALGYVTHAEGHQTIARGQYQHVQGKYNVEDTGSTEYPSGQYAHIVGGGTSDTNRKNIHTLDWNGNAWYKSLSLGGTFDNPKVNLSFNEATGRFIISVN